MAGEAQRHAMLTTHVPASDEDLDRWLLQAEEAEGAAPAGKVWSVVVAVPRLVSEVVLLRGLCRTERDRAARAEQKRDELAAELGNALAEKHRMEARVEQVEAALRLASGGQP